MAGDDAPQRVALVSGASGITGRHLLKALAKHGGWSIVSVARGRKELPVEDVVQVEADLAGPAQAVGDALRRAGVGCVTHIFHCAYLDAGDAVKDCEVNEGMLQSLVEGAEAAAPDGLQHVFTMEGTKWYGQAFHVPLETPFREDQPRHLPPNFYYSLQDYLEGRVKGGAGWTWSALRPNPVCGFTVGSAMSLTTSIAVYGAICKELGQALRFPGSLDAYNAVCEVCDAEMLAEGMLHLATTPACANRAFNISNGDVFRWRQVWPKIADFFGLEAAPPVQLPLTQVMADKGELWQCMVKEHGLQDIPYQKLPTWKFAEFVLTQPGDWFSSVQALRHTGFAGQCLDSDAMFLRQLKELREAKVIP